MDVMHRHEHRIPDLVSHLQTLAEREKAVLARELHDELGGLLVAASMDIAWLDRRLSLQGGAGLPVLAPQDGAERSANPQYAELRRHLDRLKETLASAVDIKRRIIEDLRPTLLDNVGLFAALRWLVDTSCAHSKRACTVSLPPREPRLGPDASIAVFRIAQEGLALIMHLPWTRSLTVTLSYTGNLLTLCIAGTGNADMEPVAGKEEDPESDFYQLASIQHRSTALGGSVTLASDGDTVSLRAWIPVENARSC
jgi:signal transduction histidine kinase